MVSQHDIARSLGMSQTAVSLALRNRPAVSAATIKKVQAAAIRLGYRADPMISALMAQRKRHHAAAFKAKIAFVTGYPSRDEWRLSSYAMGCYAGAKSAALARGYSCEEFWLRETGISHGRLSQILWNQNVQGLIFAPLPVEIPPIRLDWGRFAVVSLDYSLADPQVHRIVDDHGYGMERVLTEIDNLGYRRPGLVLRASQDVRTHHSRLGSFLVGRRLHPDWMDVAPLILPEDRWDADLFAHWFRRLRPDVVLTEEVELASAVTKLGIRVPRDLGIAFFHQNRVTEQWSGLLVDSKQVGIRAAEVLMRLIETNERGIPRIPTTTLVEAFAWNRGETLRQSRAAVRGRKNSLRQLTSVARGFV